MRAATVRDMQRMASVYAAAAALRRAFDVIV